MAAKYNIQHCRKVLRESDAIAMQRLDSTFAPLQRNGEIVRAWKIGTPDKFCMYREFLDDYTSVENTRPKKWAQSPMVDGEAVDDARYRQAFVRKAVLQDEQGENHTYLVQTLRRGYIETLTKGSGVNWDEARVEQIRSYPGNDNPMSTDPARYYSSKWENVSPESRLAIVEYLELKKTLTVQYRGASIGSYSVLYVLDSTEDDGSATITLFLGNPKYQVLLHSNALTERHTDTTVLHGCPRSVAQSIVTDHKSLGTSAEIGGQFSDGTVTLYLYTKTHEHPKILADIITHRDCEYDYVTSYRWGIKDADQNKYNIPTEKTAGWTYDKRVNSNGDGSVDVTIIIAKRKYREFDWETTFASGVFTTQSKKQLGVTNQDLPDISNPEAGTTYDRRVTKLSDCAANVETGRTVSAPIRQTITWKTRFGTSTKDNFLNWVIGPDEDGELKTLISSLGSGLNNSVTSGLKRDKSWDYHIVQTPYAGSTDTVAEGERTIHGLERMEYTDAKRNHFFQTVPVTYDIKGHGSSADAHTYISLDGATYNQAFPVKVVDSQGDPTYPKTMRTHGNSVSFTGGYWMAKRYLYRGAPVAGIGVGKWVQVKAPEAVGDGS